MIEPLQGFPPDVLAFAWRGRVTGEDYQAVLEPAVRAALKSRRRLDLYCELGADFEGMEAGAYVEDFKVGVEHLGRWGRVVLVSDLPWIRNTVHAFGFLMPGRVKVFHLAEAAKARQWLLAG